MTNLRHEIGCLLTETWNEFDKDEAGRRGAALAYYATFSIFPLLLLLLALFGFVLRYWDAALDAQHEILRAAASYVSPQIADLLGQMLLILKDGAGSATGIGFLTLLLGASGVFYELDDSLNRIWRVPRPAERSGLIAFLVQLVKERLMSFVMILALGVLLLVSLVLTGITQAMLTRLSGFPLISGVAGFLIGLVLTLCLNTILFAALFKYLPKTAIRWREVGFGAFVTAVLWEIAKRLLALYIAHSNYTSLYGTVGALLAIMAWVYFSSQILFLGAEFTEVFSRRYCGRAAQPSASSHTGPAKSAPKIEAKAAGD